MSAPIPGQPELSVSYTVFPTRAAAKKIEYTRAWSELVAFVREPGTYRAKGECPLLSLGTYGDVRSIKNSLKHEANLQKVGGIEGDYDSELVPLEEAVVRLVRQQCEPGWRN